MKLIQNEMLKCWSRFKIEPFSRDVTEPGELPSEALERWRD
jgi:hypothetical protein